MSLFAIGRFQPFVRPKVWRAPCTMVLGSLLLALSAQVSVPFWPVPMTMQVFAICLVAGLAGGHMAGATVLLYLAEGAVGLPVFANGSFGLAPLFGPTGGYLFGYPVAAFVAGTWIQRSRPRGIAGLTMPMLAALGIIYASGCLWLAHFVGWGSVLAVGVLPFLPGDALKVLLAAAVTLAWTRARTPK